MLPLMISFSNWAKMNAEERYSHLVHCWMTLSQFLWYQKSDQLKDRYVVNKWERMCCWRRCCSWCLWECTGDAHSTSMTPEWHIFSFFVFSYFSAWATFQLFDYSDFSALVTFRVFALFAFSHFTSLRSYYFHIPANPIYWLHRCFSPVVILTSRALL